MGFVELFLVAISLAMDAFAVSLGKGLASASVRHGDALRAGLWFGGFQALMPIIGYYLGCGFSDLVVEIDHWVAFVLLLLIGLNMIRETIWGDEESVSADFGPRAMLPMAIATSIDALAVGITMAFMHVNVWIAALVIGVVTMLISMGGVYMGSRVGDKFGSKAGILGGVILVAIGIKILIEHLGA